MPKKPPQKHKVRQQKQLKQRQPASRCFVCNKKLPANHGKSKICAECRSMSISSVAGKYVFAHAPTPSPLAKVTSRYSNKLKQLKQRQPASRCFVCNKKLPANHGKSKICAECRSMSISSVAGKYVKTHASSISRVSRQRSAKSSKRRKLLEASLGITLALSLVLGISFGLGMYKTPAKKTPTVSHKPSISHKSTTIHKYTAQTSLVPTPTSSTQAPSSSGLAVRKSTSPKSTSTTQATTSTPTSPPTPPNCTKDTTFHPATPLSISSNSPGLDKVIDSPHYYTVYGYTANEIVSQLQQCSPVVSSSDSEFDSQTTWAVNYAYTFVQNPVDFLCKLDKVAVGVHTAIVYPQWSDSPYSDAGLANDWQNYITNLTTHETGHQNIAVQDATNLYNGMMSLPETDCSTITSTTNTYANNQIAALTQDEENYDTSTNHGATQGATFP